MSTTAHPARRTRLGADDRRDQIVRAARALFAERHYDGVSTGDIATAAGTTRTNIHYHFRTKRDLYLEIVGEFSEIPDIADPAFAAGSVEVRVSTVLTRWLNAVDHNRETFLAILHGASSADPQVSGVLALSMAAWERRLLVVVGLDTSNPAHHAMVRAFQAMVAEAVASWIRGDRLSKEQVHSMLSSCLLALGASVQRS